LLGSKSDQKVLTDAFTAFPRPISTNWILED
jgi:hypothetical protein